MSNIVSDYVHLFAGVFIGGLTTWLICNKNKYELNIDLNIKDNKSYLESLANLYNYESDNDSLYNEETEDDDTDDQTDNEDEELTEEEVKEMREDEVLAEQVLEEKATVLEELSELLEKKKDD